MQNLNWTFNLKVTSTAKPKFTLNCHFNPVPKCQIAILVDNKCRANVQSSADVCGFGVL